MTVRIAGYPLHLADLLFVAVAAVGVVALTMYLRRSPTGAAIRAAAENPSRALSVGLAVDSVTARVWGLAGLFAGVAGVLGSFSGGASESSNSTFTLNVEGFTVILIAVVLARFTSITLAAGAAVVVGIVQAAVQQAYFSIAPFDALLVVIIGGILMMQREPPGRSDRDDFAENDLIRELRPMPSQLRVESHRSQLGSARVWSLGFSFSSVSHSRWHQARSRSFRTMWRSPWSDCPS